VATHRSAVGYVGTPLTFELGPVETSVTSWRNAEGSRRRAARSCGHRVPPRAGSGM